MSPADAHRECWEVLPWLANERATAKDLAHIEEHLGNCSDCREELENQRRLRDAIRAEEPVVLAPQTSLHKLVQRIDAADAEVPIESDSDLATSSSHADSLEPPRSPTGIPFGRFVTRWPRWLAVAAGVQAIAFTALLATLWMQSRETLTAPRFTTLTSHSVIPRGAVIRVVFDEGVALDEVNEMLRSIDAQVVAGPSEAGVYTLALTTHAARPASVNDALARLRADSRVVFSESAVAQSESR